MSIEGDRYTGLLGLADALARATSTRMVGTALTSHAPQIVGGSAAILFERLPSSVREQSRFEPVAVSADAAGVRSFAAVWPLGRPGFVTRPTTDPHHYRALYDALHALEPGSIAHQPVGSDGLLVIVFPGTDHSMTSVDWRVLGSIADQAAAANERIQALTRLRELSLADGATGIGNRRRVELALQQRFADAERGAPLSVVSLRSSAASEAAGEAAAPTLRRVAEQLQAAHRASDVSAHLGEGVFVVVLAASTGDGAEAFLRRVVSCIDGIEFTCGVAAHDVNFQSPVELLNAVLARVGVNPTAGAPDSPAPDSPGTSLAH